MSDPSADIGVPAVALPQDPSILGLGGSAPPYAHAHSQRNLLRELHNLLRGRYLWAIGLGCTGLVLGTLLGHYALPVTYRSSGKIKIEPTLPVILVRTEQSNVLPMFEAYVDAQVEMIKSRPVVENAMGKDVWKSRRPDQSVEALKRFIKNLSAEHPRGSQFVDVRFEDLDPDASAAAVQAVIEAYLEARAQSDVEGEKTRLQLLQGRLTSLTQEDNQISQQIMEIAQTVGSPELEPIYQDKMRELNTLESQLRTVQLELASSAPPADQRAKSPALNLLQLAQVDPTMAGYLAEQRRQSTNLQILRVQLGPNHRQVLDLQRSLVALDMMIRQRAQEFSALGSGVLPAVPEGRISADGLGTIIPTTREGLMARERQLQQMLESLRNEVKSLGDRNYRIEQLKRQQETVRRDREETRQRWDALSIESRVGGRINVISHGDRPLEPYNLGKRFQLTVAGGAFGGSLGFGVMLLLGLMDRSLRTSDDARSIVQHMRLLGILPTLPDNLTDREQASAAAFAVHHIRTMLQLSCGPGDRVFAITSPSPGTGKTSLSFALGLSFAHCGLRTLLVDADIVGAGLTFRSDAAVHPPLAEILERLGMVSAADLQAACAVADGSDRRLAQALLEQRKLTASRLQEAVQEQARLLVGVLDVLNGSRPLERCTRRLAAHLHILPVGSARAPQAASLAPRAVASLLEQARRQFDIVLIDTGPILGSIEASIVAAQADGVVLTVSRGDNRPLTLRAAEHLASIHASLAGLVFNRANDRDVVRSSYSSMHSKRAGATSAGPLLLPGRVATTESRTRHFGPIATAVVADTPQEEAGDE